jgi:hypothetical protein
MRYRVKKSRKTISINAEKANADNLGKLASYTKKDMKE